MKKEFFYAEGYRIVSGVVLLIALQGAALANQVRLPSGTVLPVRITSSISSKTAARGDSFIAEITKNTASEYGLPAGTRVDGYVSAVSAKHGSHPGMLNLAFRRIRLPDGESYPINGSLIGLDNKSVIRQSDGRLIATPNKSNERLTYIGYGAGAGLLISALTKGSALRDTLLGGGLGFLFGSLQKGHKPVPRDVVLKTGTQMGVRLDREVVFGSGGSSGYRVSQNNFHRSTSLQNSGSASDAAGIGVMVGSQNVQFGSNTPPVRIGGAILVPAAAVMRDLQASYTYHKNGSYIMARGQAGTVRLAANSRIAVVNNSRRVLLDAAARVLHNTFYVPVRFFALLTGRRVTFDNGSQTVLVH